MGSLVTYQRLAQAEEEEVEELRRQCAFKHKWLPLEHRSSLSLWTSNLLSIETARKCSVTAKKNLACVSSASYET